MPVKHWLDRFVDKALRLGKDRYTVSGGMAVSGPIHIGKIRGEVIYPTGIASALREAGKEVDHIVVIYTQDPLKAKERLVPRRFIEEWSGVRILDVPDPWGCHENWVEHFMDPYNRYIEEYGVTARPIETHKIYGMDKMKALVRHVIRNREEARKILNKYRGGKLGEDWFPIRPVCERCHNVKSTKVLSYDEETGTVEYYCPKCGYRGRTDIGNAKLEWRVEWAALWSALDVDIELYGKDHAAAGGSRDSCSELSRKLFGREPPLGFPVEWVSLKVDGVHMEMSSSGGIAFTVDEWVRVGRAEALKYWYFFMRPMTHLEFDPQRTPPQLHDELDRAERIYFGVEEPPNPDKLVDIRRAYELAFNNVVPDHLPLQVPYTLAAVISQIVPGGPGNVDEAIRRLRRTGHIRGDVDEADRERLRALLVKSNYWARKYAPPSYKIVVRERGSRLDLSEDERAFLRDLATLLRGWGGGDYIKLESEIYGLVRRHGLSSKRAFRIAYMAILGRRSGPRLASLILAVGTDKIVKLLEEAIG